LTSALIGGEWSASGPRKFTSKERAPGTHWIGDWMGPGAGLDEVPRGSNILNFIRLSMYLIQQVPYYCSDFLMASKDTNLSGIQQDSI
jgi:hypothetical protein